MRETGSIIMGVVPGGVAVNLGMGVHCFINVWILYNHVTVT